VGEGEPDLEAATEPDIDGRLLELMGLHERPLYRFLLVLTGNSEVALDCAQDAFVRAYEMLRKGKTAKGISPIEEERLRQHLEACPGCQSAASEYDRQDASLRAMHFPEPPASLHEGVLARIGGKAPSHSPSRLFPSIETVAFLVAAVVIVVAAVLHLHQSQRGPHLPQVGPSLPTVLHGPPSPARSLASRLGIRGMPAIGVQPNGRHTPWSVWFPRAIAPGSLRLGNVPHRHLQMSGPALFAGPTGASGEFHYFNSTILSWFGGDSYRGPQLIRQQVIAIAHAWFRRTGEPWPPGHFHVALGFATTFIGGTGRCCFHILDQIYWGGRQDRFGIVENPSAEIYIADRGTVVQVDTGPVMNLGGYGFSQPFPGRTHRDRNGIILGIWCFDYASAVRTMIVANIGGHSSGVNDPDQMGFVSGIGPKGGPSHRVSLKDTHAVYTETYRGVRYRMTLVPAFPSLPGSIWELEKVERRATTWRGRRSLAALRRRPSAAIRDTDASGSSEFLSWALPPRYLA